MSGWQRLLWLAWVGNVACASAPVDRAARPPSRPPGSATAAAAAPAAPSGGGPVADRDSARPSEPAPPERTAPFPPAAYAPMHERTAQPSDGRWTAFPTGAAEPLMVRSEVHPDPYKKYVFTTVIAIDRSRVALGLVAGTDEPKSTTVPAAERTGLIPAEHHADLIAVFNGGFMARHGGHGMMLDGLQFVPPREGRCTIAFYRDGRLRIRSWEQLVAEVDALRSYRQTSPCLVEQGVVHPELPSEYSNRRWGAAEDGKRDVRRSALCLDQSGETLMYGFGDYITATQFAHALKQAGGYDCAQLDINWSYTRFFLVDHSTEPPTLGDSFIEKLKYNRASYITKPYWKDFFYLWRRR